MAANETDNWARTWLAEQTHALSSIGKDADAIAPDACTVLLRVMLAEESPVSLHTLVADTGLNARQLAKAISYLLIHEAVQDTTRWYSTFDEPKETFYSKTKRADRVLRELKMRVYRLGKASTRTQMKESRLPLPTPYDFSTADWRTVLKRRFAADSLRVVFGIQYNSHSYDPSSLHRRMKRHFSRAVSARNRVAGSSGVKLRFVKLAGGLGEHLFTSIARSILSADIAVFDVSDRNANVMLELGVALTWGVPVIPVFAQGTNPPPSDIAGFHYLEYTDSGRAFTDVDATKKIQKVVRRAIHRKTEHVESIRQV